MRSLSKVLLCVTWALAAAPLLAAETVSNEQLGLRLTVPDGFVRDPREVPADVVYLFQRPPEGDEQAGVFITVVRMPDVLKQQKMNPEVLAARAPHESIVEERWKDFDLEVTRKPKQEGKLQTLYFYASVPLKPNAICVVVCGEAAREEELRGVLRFVLQNLDGQTNWRTTKERYIRLMTDSLVFLAPVGFLLWRVIRKRKARPTTTEPQAAANPPRD